MTIKMRTGYNDNSSNAHTIVQMLQKAAYEKGGDRLSAIMIHGRSKHARYAKKANWDYIAECARSQDTSLPLIPIIGNGDIMSYDDWFSHQSLLETKIDDTEVLGLCSCAMLGRGALIKPWLGKEIHDKQNYDISATERLEMLKRFVSYGFEQYGTDTHGVETTRRFFLEWQSYLHRYVPLGITDAVQTISQTPPLFNGRSDLETLLSSPHVADWIKLSEMLI